MADERLRVILEYVTKGEGQLKAARGELQQLDNAAGKARSSWQSAVPVIGAVGVAFGGLALAARGAWSALEGGAAILETQGKFDRLSQSIGTTGDALRNDLGEGIGLLMTQSQQMGLATDLMSLGLAKTHDEAVRLSTVAGKLGMDMSQLVLTLTNQTTMRFDQLGVRVDGFKEKVEALEAAGMSADEAFKWAFIEQAEAQIELVGDRSDTTAGQLDMLKTAVTGAWEQFQVEFAEGVIQQFSDVEGGADQLAISLGKAAVQAANLILALGGIPAAIEALPQVRFLNEVNQAGFALRQSILGGRAGGFGNPLSWATPGTDNLSWGALNQAGQLGRLGGAYTPPSRTGLGFNTWQEGFGPARPTDGASVASAQRAKDEWLEAATVQEQISETYKQLHEDSLSVGGAIGTWIDPLQEAASTLQQIQAETGNLFARLRGQKDFNLWEEVFNIAAASGRDPLFLSQLGVQSGLFDQGRANELLRQTFLLNQAQTLFANAQGLSAEQAISTISGLEAGGDQLAQGFFMDVNSALQELTPSLKMDQVNQQLFDLQSTPLVFDAVINLPSNSAVSEAVQEGQRSTDPPKPELP